MFDGDKNRMLFSNAKKSERHRLNELYRVLQIVVSESEIRKVANVVLFLYDERCVVGFTGTSMDSVDGFGQKAYSCNTRVSPNCFAHEAALRHSKSAVDCEPRP